MLKGFKDFIARGNAVDLAVGVVIGGAFGAVVTAVVESVLNPLIAGIFGKPDFTQVGEFTLGGATVQPGAVLTALVNFLLVAAALYFCVVVPMNKLADLRKKEVAAEEAAAAPEPSDEAKLLVEIRDLLANK